MPRFCAYKAILGRGQHPLMRWIWYEPCFWCRIDRLEYSYWHILQLFSLNWYVVIFQIFQNRSALGNSVGSLWSHLQITKHPYPNILFSTGHRAHVLYWSFFISWKIYSKGNRTSEWQRQTMTKEIMPGSMMYCA